MKQFLLSLLISTAFLSSPSFAAEWTKIASRNVDFKTDVDVIKVGKSQGLFKAIKIDVDRGGIEMYDIVVHFENGEKFSPKTRVNFAKGSLSRTIDLPGDARAIEKVRFVYKSKGKKRKKIVKAKMEFYGKKVKAKKAVEKLFPNWKHLGSRDVAFKVEKDSINVLDDGKIRSFRIYVAEGNLEMYNIVVHFANGKKFSPDTRLKFSQGSNSRDIDLPGDARRVTKITFLYSSSSKKKGKAKIHVFGKK